jgi:hypothetical protein
MRSGCRYRLVAYRPETPYFVRLDEPPPVSRYAPQQRERQWESPSTADSGPKRRRRRRFTIRPVGVVLVAVLGWVGWAYTTPGGPSARISSWIDHTRGVVDTASIGPGLHQTATYFDQLYAAEGSYPNLSETTIQEDPKAGFGLGMNFIWCNEQAVVLQAPTAGGTVSRLLIRGHDIGDVTSAAGCPANLAHPAPWKLAKKVS